MSDVLVAGAGLAGLSAAFHLGGSAAVVDREKEPGGTARSYAVGGFTFDFTGHLLHLHEDYTRRLVRRLLKGNVMECRRNAWIHSHGVNTRYPFQANLHGLPTAVIEECYRGLREARRLYGDTLPSGLTFREWCERLFGAGISRHFMVPYNEKLWRTSPDEMTPDWCGGFVPRPALEDVLAGAALDHDKAFGYNATFLYPKTGGIQVLAQALARGLPDLRLGVSLEKVFWKKRSARFSSGGDFSYRRMISTLPLPELLKRLDPFPPELAVHAEALRWTSVLCVNVGVAREKISDASWIYFPEKKFVFYRAGFPMNFTPHAVPAGCSSMYVEVSYRPGENMKDKAAQARVFRKIREGLIAAKILRRADRFPVVSFAPIPYAYVVYDAHRSAALQSIFAWLETNGILSIGRYGGWKYSFMAEAILDGKKAAEQVRAAP